MPTSSFLSGFPNPFNLLRLLILTITVSLLSTTTIAIILDAKLYPDELVKFVLMINENILPHAEPYEVVVSSSAKECPLPVSMWKPGDPGKAVTDPTYDFMINDEFFRQRGLETAAIETAAIIPCYSRAPSQTTFTPAIFFSKTRLTNFPAYVHTDPSRLADNDDHDPRPPVQQASTNTQCNNHNGGDPNATWAPHPPICSLESKTSHESNSTPGTMNKIVCKNESGPSGTQTLQCRPNNDPQALSQPPQQPPPPQSFLQPPRHHPPSTSTDLGERDCSMFLYIIRPFLGDNGPGDIRWLECFAQSPASSEIETSLTHNSFPAVDYPFGMQQLHPRPAYYRDISFDYIPDVPLNGDETEHAKDNPQRTQHQSSQQQQPHPQHQSAHQQSFQTKHQEERHPTNNARSETDTISEQERESTSLRDNYLRALEYDRQSIHRRRRQQQPLHQPQRQDPNESTPPPLLQTNKTPDPIPVLPRVDYLKITFTKFPASTLIDFQLAFGLATQSLLDESNFFSDSLMKWIQWYWSSTLRQNKPYATCGHHGARLLIRPSGPNSRMVFTLALSPSSGSKYIFPEVATCTIPIPILLVHHQLSQRTRRNFPQGWENQQISVTLRLDETQGNLLYTYPTTHEKARWNFLDPQLSHFVFPSLTQALSPKGGHIIITQEFQINGPMPEVFLKRTYPPIPDSYLLQHLFSPFEEGSKAPAGLLAWEYDTTTALGTASRTRHRVDPELALEGKPLYFEDHRGYVRLTFTVIVALADIQFFVLEWSINNNPHYTTLTPRLAPTYSITQPDEDTMVIDYNLRFRSSITVFDANRRINKRIKFTDFADKDHLRQSLEAIPFGLAVQPRLHPFEPNITEQPSCYATIYQQGKDGKAEEIDKVSAPSVENPWLHFMSPTQRFSYQVDGLRFNFDQWVTLKCTYPLNAAMREHWPLPFDRTDVDDFSRWTLHSPVLFTQYFEPISIKQQSPQPTSNPAAPASTIQPAQLHQLEQQLSQLQQEKPDMATMVNFIFISLKSDRKTVESMLAIATIILNTSTFMFEDSEGVIQKDMGLKTFNRDQSSPFEDSDWHFLPDLNTTARVGEGGIGTCLDYPNRMFDDMESYTPDEISLETYNTQDLNGGMFQHATCFLLSTPFHTNLDQDEAHLLHLKLRNHVLDSRENYLLHYHSVSPRPTRTGPRVVDLFQFIFPEKKEDGGKQPTLASKSGRDVNFATPFANDTVSTTASQPQGKKNAGNDGDPPFTQYASTPLPAGAPCFVDGNCHAGHRCLRQRCIYSYLQSNFVTDADLFMLAVLNQRSLQAGLPSLVNAAFHSWTPNPPSTSSDDAGKLAIVVVLIVLAAILCVAAFCLYRVARLSNKGQAQEDILMTLVDNNHAYEDEYWSGSDEDDT